MRATELKQGEEYRVQYVGQRCRLVKKGQGHGPVHTIEVLDLETGAVIPRSDGTLTHKVSSRDFTHTWTQVMQNDPQVVERWRADRIRKEAAKQERELAEQFADMLEGVCAETAGLLNILGFEATVVANSPNFKDRGFYIRIDNPTENQDLLRRMVSEKWKGTLDGGD